MQLNLRKLSMVLGTSLMMLPLGAADCLGPVEDPPCELDTDCAGTDQCHPLSGECVADCSLDDAAACPAEAPICNGVDESGAYPLETYLTDEGMEVTAETERLRSICVCVADSDCGDGEICDEGTRTCVEGEREGEGDAGVPDAGEPDAGETDAGPAPCTSNDDCEGDICDVASGECIAACDPVGDVNTSDEVCTPAGVYEALCADWDCWVDGDLCIFDDTDAETYNTCVEANVVTGNCSDAEGHVQEAGPVISFIEMDEVISATANCDFPIRYFAEVYSDVAFDSSLYSQRINLLSNGMSSDTFSEGPNSGVHPSVDAVPDFDDEYILTFYLCSDSAMSPEFAIFLTDNEGAAGNAYCF